MIDKKRIDEAKKNFERYLENGRIKRERNEAAYFTYLKKLRIDEIKRELNGS